MKKVLIIDDEHAYVSILSTALKELDVQLFYAANGQQGLDTMLQHRPDLTFLDIYMPLKNGLECLEMLRQDPWGKEAHVILLTNIDYNETIDKAYNLGVMDYIIKSQAHVQQIINLVKTKLL